MQGLGFSLTEVGELLNLRERKVEACESVKQLLVTKLGNVRSKLAYLVWLDAVDGGARQILVMVPRSACRRKTMSMAYSH